MTEIALIASSSPGRASLSCANTPCGVDMTMRASRTAAATAAGRLCSGRRFISNIARLSSMRRITAAAISQPFRDRVSPVTYATRFNARCMSACAPLRRFVSGFQEIECNRSFLRSVKAWRVFERGCGRFCRVKLQWLGFGRCRADGTIGANDLPRIEGNCSRGIGGSSAGRQLDGLA